MVAKEHVIKMGLRADSDDIEVVVGQIGRDIEGLPAGDAEVAAVNVPARLEAADCIGDVGTGWLTLLGAELLPSVEIRTERKTLEPGTRCRSSPTGSSASDWPAGTFG